MSNLLSLSLNNAESSSDTGSNGENLIQNTNNNNDNNNLDKDTATTMSKKNYTFKEKFISTFLNIKPKKKKKNKSDNKIIVDEFINKNIEFADENNLDNESINSEEIEEPNVMLNKFRALVKKVLRTKKNKNWKEFMKEYERKVKEEKSFKFRMKNIFNVNSDFIIVWKSTFSAFNIIFIFIYFLKYNLLELSIKKKDEEIEKSNRILYLYYMINLMFSF